MTNEELAGIIKSVNILQIKPDDILVFKTDAILTNDQKIRMTEMLSVHMPAQKIMILDAGIDIDILRGVTNE